MFPRIDYNDSYRTQTDVDFMSNHKKEVIGAWMQAFGNIVEAYGSTPSTPLTSETRDDFNRIGLTMQSVGSALEADGQSNPHSFEYYGAIITSIGSVEELLPLIQEFSLETDYLLEVQGNILQGIGSALQAYDEFVNGSPSGALEGIIGNSVQSIGCFLSVSGINLELTNQEDGEKLNALGTWVQAFGATLAAIGQQLEEAEESGQGHYAHSNAPFYLE